MSEIEPNSDVAALTVQLLSAYLSNNTVASDELAGLILSTKKALTEEEAVAAVEPAPETFTPAVSARKSLASPEHIISLIDGKPYRTLKRHLTANGLTPDEYRSRYELSASYPMVAPAYSAHRREVAQKIGLGSRRKKAAMSVPADGLTASAHGTIEPEASSTAAKPEAKKRQPKTSAAKPKVSARKAKRVVPDETEAQAVTQPAVMKPTPADASTDIAQASVTSAGDDGFNPKASGTRTRRQPKTPQPKTTLAKASKSSTAKPNTTTEASIDAPADGDRAGGEQASDKGVEPAQGKPKRRGKIGLFSKEDDQATSASDVAKPLKSGSAAKGTKVGRPKRMARTPGSATKDAAG